MAKRIIRLKESDIYNIVTRVIKEQDTGILTDQQAVDQLTKEVNEILKSTQNEIFKAITLTFVRADANEVVYKTNGGQRLVLKTDEEAKQLGYQVWSLKYPGVFDLGEVPVQQYLTSVYENPDYQTLFKNQPQVKAQLDAQTASCFMYPQGGRGTAMIFKGTMGPGKNGKDLNEPFSLIDLFNQNGEMKFQVEKKTQFNLEIGNAALQLDDFFVKGPLTKPNTGDIPGKSGVTTTTTTVPIQWISIRLDNSGSEPFIFDTTTIHPDSVAKIDEFVDKIKNVQTKYGNNIYNQYIQFLKSKPIVVNAYASIDGDPSQKIGGKLQACKGYGDGSRGQYNLCLSQKRAEVIANELNSRLPELGNFKGVGIGETDKFDVGKKWPKVTNQDETILNRRFEVVLPDYSTTQRL
jgi:hypothetical protein